MPNIVVVPFPLQGHINPCVDLANLLVPHGFTFTIVIPESLGITVAPNAIPSPNPNPNPNPNPVGEQQEEPSPAIGYATVPAMSMEEARSAAAPGSASLIWQMEVVRSMQAGFEELVVRKQVSHLAAGAGGLSCAIIGDCFVPWVADTGRRLGLPVFHIYTTNAHALCSVLHYDKLAPLISDAEAAVDFLPGVGRVRVADLPQSVRTQPGFVGEVRREVGEGEGLILNTVYELERGAVEGVEGRVAGRPVYTVGPMRGPGTGPGGRPPGMWAEDRRCIGWLGARAPSSVVYVSFGSLASLGARQAMELADGLEATGRPFIWVVRPDSAAAGVPPPPANLRSLLEASGFIGRTLGRGLVVPWAPQLLLLSHPALGGFLTHCGWNSVVENLSARCVPMLCWPQLAEQRLNARVLVDEWRVALELPLPPLQPGDDAAAAVGADTIRRALDDLMCGDRRKEIEDRAARVGELLSRAARDGGSSHRSLLSLARHLHQASAPPVP